MTLKEHFIKLCRRLARQQADVHRQKLVVETSKDPIRDFTTLDELESAEVATRCEIDDVLDAHNASKNIQSNQPHD